MKIICLLWRKMSVQDVELISFAWRVLEMVIGCVHNHAPLVVTILLPGDSLFFGFSPPGHIN